MIFYKILYSLCEFVKKRIQVKFKEIFLYKIQLQKHFKI